MREGLLFAHLKSSFFRVSVGFCMALICALPLGVLCGCRDSVEDLFSPLLTFFRSVPPIALFPLFILWLGLGELPKVTLIALTAFFPIYLNAFSAVRSVDAKLLEVGIVFRLTPMQRFTRIALPCMVPQLLTGFRLGVAYSWRALIGVELLASSSGLGFLILESEQIGRSDRIFVAIFLTALMGYLMDTALRFLSCFYTGKYRPSLGAS